MRAHESGLQKSDAAANDELHRPTTVLTSSMYEALPPPNERHVHPSPEVSFLQEVDCSPLLCGPLKSALQLPRSFCTTLCRCIELGYVDRLRGVPGRPRATRAQQHPTTSHTKDSFRLLQGQKVFRGCARSRGAQQHIVTLQSLLHSTPDVLQ